ncbi:MAG: M56 family metallopeptidase, partial [Candidatus Komeilibacteria bacterium]|nr:M56 family metallopeptidase [Candidatus Komeilibacteria bacterium]
ISSGLIKILRPDELEAVLSHEHHHMVSREPVKLFMIKYFQNVFGWLPGIKIFITRYVTFSELAADERATNNFTDRLKLARALFKISVTEEKQLLRAGLALSFFSSIIIERVNKLSDNAYAPRFRLWGREFLFGLGSVLVGLLAIFIFLSDSSKALAMHNNGSCVSSNGANQNRPLICVADNHSRQAATGCNMD